MDASVFAGAGRSLAEAMEHRPLVSSLRNFELVTDNQAFLQGLAHDIDGAKHHVGAWMFSWQPDGAGSIVKDALVRAARRGVDVDLIVDGLGSRQLPFSGARRFIDEVEGAGGTVRRAWPLQRNEAGKLRLTSGHDHMKLFEIDGETGWTGGRNLAEKYDTWHDYMVRFEGPAASMLGAEHARRMTELGGEVSPERLRRLGHAWQAQARLDGLESVRLLRTDPLNGRTEPRDALFTALGGAKREAFVTTPYFGSDKAAGMLADAAERGVNTIVGVPGPNQWKNGQYAIHATRSYYPALEGARVVEYPYMSHAKANAIDGAGMIGSVNVGKRALQLDQELMLEFKPGSRASTVIRAQVLKDIATGSAPPAGAGDGRIAHTIRVARRITGIEQ
ncbi:MAG: cardiolipin synthase [Thermoleophilia bacterium]|nr:cardiolipin synthase [Thermoleophilia bacterium]